MEGATSGRRTRQEHSGRSSHSHREYERTYSVGNLSFGEKGEDWHTYEKQRKIPETTKGSNSRGGRIINSIFFFFFFVGIVLNNGWENSRDTRDWLGWAKQQA